ncbi:putative peptidase S10, serine carboxypeptidase, alpha/Beta hydrolase [Helianthus anomalus]
MYNFDQIYYVEFPCITTLILSALLFQCISNINLANILGTVPDDTADIKIILDAWANDKEVQKALHIREGTIGVWEKTNETIHFTFRKNDTICYSYDVSSTIVYHEQLISRNCQVLIIRYNIYSFDFYL